MTDAILKGRTAGVLGVMVMLAGCATEEDHQVRTAVDAATSVQNTRQELVKAGLQVDETLAAIDQLASAPSDLRQAYTTFVSEVSQTLAQTGRARVCTTTMCDYWRGYIGRWEKEIDLIATPQLHEQAVQRRQALRQNYDSLRGMARSVETAYQPFLLQLQDIRRTLSLDLTPVGVEAAKPAFQIAHQSGKEVRQQIDAFILELDRVAIASPSAPQSSDLPADPNTN